MLKRNIAIVAIAVVVLGVGAYAWAEGAPARPTTSAPAAAVTANGRPGRAGHPGLALLRRAVHGDVIVRQSVDVFWIVKVALTIGRHHPGVVLPQAFKAAASWRCSRRSVPSSSRSKTSRTTA